MGSAERGEEFIALQSIIYDCLILGRQEHHNLFVQSQENASQCANFLISECLDHECNLRLNAVAVHETVLVPLSGGTMTPEAKRDMISAVVEVSYCIPMFPSSTCRRSITR